MVSVKMVNAKSLRTERRLGVGRGGEAATKGLICIILLFSLLIPY